jgi:8-oxo-dGTP pyrophosphatase MutT (NUDIX family)
MTDERHDSRLLRWAREGKPGATPVPAATVVLLRDGAEGPEVLMLRRNSKIAFGGMWVFPGGRVDAEDRAGLSADDDLGAARAAAVREAREESGLEIALDGLVPFSHWTPPRITPKRFLTWFFLALAPEGSVAIDHGEIHEHAWMSAARAMERQDAAEIELAPPTWVTLHALAHWRTVEEALAASRDREPEYFETHVAAGDAGPIALWQGDAGWEKTDITAPGARHRLSMGPQGWLYERTC